MDTHIYSIFILVAIIAFIIAVVAIKIVRRIDKSIPKINIGNPVTTTTEPSKTGCRKYYFIIEKADLEFSDDYTLYCEFTGCDWFPKTLNFGSPGKSLNYCVAGGVLFSISIYILKNGEKLHPTNGSTFMEVPDSDCY